MKVGLGSGSTFLFALERLGERIRDDDLQIVGLPTSDGTAQAAREHGVPLTSFDEVSQLDLTIDGADEIDPGKNMIKGGGGALLREKIVAAASTEMVVVVGSTKLVDHLGQTFKLPIEVLPFGHGPVDRALRNLGLTPNQRLLADGSAYMTDSGNLILDCDLPESIDPATLDITLNAIPGVVENGIFAGLAGRIIVSDEAGSVRIID